MNSQADYKIRAYQHAIGTMSHEAYCADATDRL
jgi:hypothetical protein